MVLNSSTIKKILDIQKELNIHGNELILIAYMIKEQKAVQFKTIVKEETLSQEDVLEYAETLMKNELITEKDLSFIKKLSFKTSNVITLDYTSQTEDLVNHLNNLTGKNRRVSPDKIALVKKWLMKGYSIEDLILVNEHKFYEWGKDQKMSKFLKFDTLYNTKFPSRLEEAKLELDNFNKYHEQIISIFNAYNKSYFDFIISKLKIDDLNESVKNPSFQEQSSIVFWLSQKYELEDIVLTINSSISDFSKDPKKIPYITLEKLLDDKFPTRLDVAKKREKLNNNNILANNDSASDRVQKWAEDNS